MGFRFTHSIHEFPALYPKADRILATVKTKSKTKVGDFTLRHKIDYIPQTGMQEDVCACEANLVFMCGQGTSGKTFTMYLKALSGIDRRDFKARLISVRALDSKKGSSMFTDGLKVCGGYADCEASSSDIPSFVWSYWNSNLQLIHSNFNYANPDEKKLFEDYAKKNQASLIMIDEATEMNHFGMFSFWFMRNRDDSGMIPQMILSFNPLHEHWTTKMLLYAGYLDENWYLRKDMIGKIRYFYVKGDTPEEIIWGDTRQEVVDRAKPKISQEDRDAGLTELDMVKSFTVFTGTAADNRELVNATQGQSVANLHAVGATQRAIVGEAYFGPIEKETFSVSKEMIRMLWQNPEDDNENRYATMDISSGKSGNDRCPMVIWQGLRIIAIEQFQGEPSELAAWIQRKLDFYNIPVSNFAYDATGHGYWVQAFTSGMPVTWNRRTMQEYDINGNPVIVDEYFNLRSQLLGKTEVLIKSGAISCVMSQDTLIPYGRKNETRRLIDILYDEIALFSRLQRNRKIYYRSTDEFKARFRYSPDLMTAIALRAIFELDSRKRKEPKPQTPPGVYKALYKRHNSGRKILRYG
ncbi:MAG: hypothetical protein HDS14_00465 [Bacteroides sp.]|nr:hypothetical protein [Bacteroides sp.]